MKCGKEYFKMRKQTGYEKNYNLAKKTISVVREKLYMYLFYKKFCIKVIIVTFFMLS